jgi:hypothetical protein
MPRPDHLRLVLAGLFLGAAPAHPQRAGLAMRAERDT